MSCKYNWWNLPIQIENKLNISLKYNWHRIPIELNKLLREYETDYNECYLQFFKPNQKLIWFTLPSDIEKLCNLINCVEQPPSLNYNFDIEYTGTGMFDYYGIEDEATFISFLESQGATNIIVTDFQLTPSRLRCNLLFDGITSLFLSDLGINKINNLDALVNLNYLDLQSNQITTIENLDSLVNLAYLDLSSNQIITIENLDSLVNLTALNLFNNQITTAQFNILNSWAILAPISGSINTNNNTDNFNTSTTYTTLLGKGWTITL